ncbi:hypothetical protein Y1Q_0003196 [Alligator mississippiensis]|uniref:Uncharacterized protein n=1 Tax=Alligator mississippiensis TaxID=8496 RepID=A0A151MDT9_ALLMI|nr:hypothetical protein Y1Q_0003196 [Alligator mississippiensis]
MNKDSKNIESSNLGTSQANTINKECSSCLCCSHGTKAVINPATDQTFSLWCFLSSSKLRSALKGSPFLLQANIWTWERSCRTLRECHLRVTTTHHWSLPDMSAVSAVHQGLDPPVPAAGGGHRKLVGVEAGLAGGRHHPGNISGESIGLGILNLAEGLVQHCVELL